MLVKLSENHNDSDGFGEQQTDYYPYGLPMDTSNTIGAEKNQYKYGGTRSVSKPFERRRENEYETENALNQYDFEARTHLPALAQFSTPDPFNSEMIRYPGL